jgi:hypothetical protein
MHYTTWVVHVVRPFSVVRESRTNDDAAGVWGMRLQGSACFAGTGHASLRGDRLLDPGLLSRHTSDVITWGTASASPSEVASGRSFVNRPPEDRPDLLPGFD